MKRIVDAIGRFTETWGFGVSLLILPMVGVVIYEVIMRRIFNMPTSWAFDVIVYLYAAHFMLAKGYVERGDGHVRVDAITRLLSQRTRDWLKLITFIIMFIPYVGAMSFAGLEYAFDSWVTWEHSQSAWKPPIYPIKTIIPVAFLILLVQGLANFYQHVRKMFGGEA